MTQSPAIEVIDLQKSYGSAANSIRSIEKLSFSVEAGEFVSILGPSGCGKTTALKIIAGLTDRTSGIVKVDGVPVTGPQRKIGLVFQVPALMKWRTVEQNVLLPAEILGLDLNVARKRAGELLELVGLDSFAARNPQELSGGMQQRVSIARALVHDPEILLLDEPFSALDMMTRNQLNIELLRIWSARKKTSLLITHSISEAVFLSDRIIVFGPRPAKILDVIQVPLPRPRDPSIRVSLPFIEIVNQIGRLIGLEYA
jgi:NitT/TauT family transport system ATP-binding protein